MAEVVPKDAAPRRSSPVTSSPRISDPFTEYPQTRPCTSRSRSPAGAQVPPTPIYPCPSALPVGSSPLQPVKYARAGMPTVVSVSSGTRVEHAQHSGQALPHMTCSHNTFKASLGPLSLREAFSSVAAPPMAVGGQPTAFFCFIMDHPDFRFHHSSSNPWLQDPVNNPCISPGEDWPIQPQGNLCLVTCGAMRPFQCAAALRDSRLCFVLAASGMPPAKGLCARSHLRALYLFLLGGMGCHGDDGALSLFSRMWMYHGNGCGVPIAGVAGQCPPSADGLRPLQTSCLVLRATRGLGKFM